MIQLATAADGIGLAANFMKREAGVAIIKEGGVALFHEGFGIEKTSNELVANVSSKRDVLIAGIGSDELKYLDMMNAEAVAQVSTNTQILLRENPSKVAVLEEFLHGTQNRLGMITGTDSQDYAQWHIRDFMIRHSKFYGSNIANNAASIGDYNPIFMLNQSKQRVFYEGVMETIFKQQELISDLNQILLESTIKY